MGDALLELELAMRTSKEKLTREEERILQTSKANGIRGFTIGGVVAFGLMWTATRMLSNVPRSHGFLYSGGAAAIGGMWNCDRTLNSWLDHILAMQGSRMQSMLAGIILTRHQHSPKKLQLVKKHFYPEKVFDDTCMDEPISRWRRRNFSGEDIGQSPGNIHVAKPKQEPEQFTITPAKDVIADPLECILGYAKPSYEIHDAKNTGSPLRRRHVRGQKRAQRRHRIEHRENS